MNNNYINIKIFNDILEQFLDYLENEFILTTIISEIIMTKNTILLLKNNNPKLVIEQFKILILPYSKQIYDCDEEFFINFEKNIKIEDTNNLLTCLKFKDFFTNSNLDELKILHQKATLFYYFQNLLKYACLIN